MFLKTEVDAEMFAPTVSILLEFHKRVQKKKFPCNVRGIGRSPVDMTRIFLFPINYLGLGHYQIFDHWEYAEPHNSFLEHINRGKYTLYNEVFEEELGNYGRTEQSMGCCTEH